MAWKIGIVISLIFGLSSCGHDRHRYQGYVQADMIYLSQGFSGILKKACVNRGDKVKKGQLVFVLDPYPQLFNLQHAEAVRVQGLQLLIDLTKARRAPEIDAIKAQLMQVNAEISLAELRLRRNETLYAKNVLSKDALDASQEYLRERQGLKAQFEANLALAKLGGRPNQIAAQQAASKALDIATEQAKWSLAQKKIYAPADGVIFDTYYIPGEFVDTGRPLASMLAPVETYIEFFVPVRDLHDVEIGTKITFSYEQTAEAFPATVTYISSHAEYVPPLVYSRDNDEKIVFRIKASVPAKTTLISGEPVTVVVESAHGKH